VNPVCPEREPGRVGVVVIGRNEGERLRRCLTSLFRWSCPLVYVDSGSSDGSVELATRMGARVVELDMSVPFSAARARNVGFARLRETTPELDLVHFVDGDCEMSADWLRAAESAIRGDATVAVVCGRLRERHPQASIYNRLCDLEWDAPRGFVSSSGGIALMRAQAFADVGGFNPALIGGEEPDLCLRLRQRGHRILRISDEMGLHDANMTRFGQWWRRSMRGGYAYAEGYLLHRHESEAYFGKQTRSNLFWGLLLPTLVLGLIPLTGGWSSLLLLGYPVLGIRVFRSGRRRGLSSENARLNAAFCVLSKFPSAYGQMRYWVRRARGKRSQLIEYKRPSA